MLTISEEALREKARKLVESVVPFKYGDANYQEVCKFFQKGFGTSCGCLCHWMMYKLGAANPDIVNWTDPARGLSFLAGANVSRIYHKNTSPFVACTGRGINPLMLGLRPATGDIIFIHQPGGPQNKEHVFVFLDEVRQGDRIKWKTAESGQEGGTDSKFKTRVLHLPSGNDVKLKADVKISDMDNTGPADGDRTVMGWLDLSKLDYVGTP